MLRVCVLCGDSLDSENWGDEELALRRLLGCGGAGLKTTVAML